MRLNKHINFTRVLLISIIPRRKSRTISLSISSLTNDLPHKKQYSDVHQINIDFDFDFNFKCFASSKKTYLAVNLVNNFSCMRCRIYLTSMQSSVAVFNYFLLLIVNQFASKVINVKSCVFVVKYSLSSIQLLEDITNNKKATGAIHE